MQAAIHDAADPNLPPEQRAHALQAYRQFRAEHQALIAKYNALRSQAPDPAGLAKAVNDLAKPMTPEQQAGYQKAVRDGQQFLLNNAQKVQEASDRVQAGQGTPADKQLLETHAQTVNSLDEAAMRLGYKNAHSPTNRTDGRLAQDLGDPNPNNQVGTITRQTGDPNFAQQWWNNSTPGQKLWALGGLALGAFGIMSVFTGNPRAGGARR